MKKIFIVLIIFDLLWAALALAYDWSAIAQIPFYFWPFIVICPIYPFLLALAWYQKVRSNHINSYLLAFAAIPSTTYFVGAIIYYPTLMVLNGFNFLAFGSIFWVAYYGLQGIYLAIKEKIALVPLLCAILFIITSFIIQFFSKTFSYLDITGLDDLSIVLIYVFILVILTLFFLIINNSRKTQKKN